MNAAAFAYAVAAVCAALGLFIASTTGRGTVLLHAGLAVALALGLALRLRRRDPLDHGDTP